MADNWGLTETGFYCPTYEEILAEKITDAQELFGDDISTSALTPLGKFLRIEAKADRRLYEECERVYYSFSPATSTGVSLDRAVSFAGITRQPATAAVHTIYVYTGVADYTIAQGTEFRTTAGVVFRSLEDAAATTKATESGVETGEYYAEVRVQCTELGTVGNVSNINSLVTADTNITGIAYTGCESEGTDTETDAELYERYKTIVDGLGTNTAVSIAAAVLKIAGVKDCVVLTKSEELGIEEDAANYAVIVYTTSTSEATLNSIAKAIFTHGAFGVPTLGTTTVAYEDEAGVEHSVNFYLAREKSIDIAITYKPLSSFPNDGEETIKDNINELIDSIGIGDDFVCSTMYEKIYSVGGIMAATITVTDEDGNTYYSDDTITAEDDEVIVCGSVAVSEV